VAKKLISRYGKLTGEAVKRKVTYLQAGPAVLLKSSTARSKNPPPIANVINSISAKYGRKTFFSPRSLGTFEKSDIGVFANSFSFTYSLSL